jgi:flavorubredoxin
MARDGDDFMQALASVIDPRDLRWVWVTHDDADHTGNLQRVLGAAPEARLAAFSLGVLRMSTAWDVPLHRVNWLNPGDSISAGDRTLTAVRPPLFDNPTTIGLYDDRSRAFFSADCFGAVIPSPARDVEEVDPEALAGGLMGWASLDNPWVHMLAPDELERGLERIRKLDPSVILSGHLPPAHGRTGQLLDLLAAVPGSTPAVAPDQAALEQLLALGAGSPSP